MVDVVIDIACIYGNGHELRQAFCSPLSTQSSCRNRAQTPVCDCVALPSTAAQSNSQETWLHDTRGKCIVDSSIRSFIYFHGS